MEAGTAFVDQLSAALETKRAALEAEQASQLKEHFRVMKSSFESVTNILQRKNLLSEDPYKYETKISDVEIPDDSTFGDFERDERMSVRLSHYDSVLEFLVNYYEFAIDALDLKRLKDLLAFVSYLKWDQFNAQVLSPTTRSLAELTGRLRGGGDNLSANLMTDALEQLAGATRAIKQILKEVAEYQKEAYKLRLRRHVFTAMEISEAKVLADRDGVVAQVRKRFSQLMAGEPFVPDLVAAALDEDYTPDAQELHEAILRKLEVKKQVPKRPDTSLVNRALLIEAVRAAGGASRPLLDAVAKLNESNGLIAEKQISLGERVRRFFMKLSGNEEESGRYEVEYFDETTGAPHTEVIEYDSFIERVSKKAKTYSVLADRVSSPSRRLEQGSEEQLFDFVNKDLGELHVIHRRLKSLDTYFKTEVPREQRARLRGIKIELTTIKNQLIKANQKRREYVARKEEEEQLKRLGITSD